MVLLFFRAGERSDACQVSSDSQGNLPPPIQPEAAQKNYLATINPENCDDCRTCVAKCPTRTITGISLKELAQVG